MSSFDILSPSRQAVRITVSVALLALAVIFIYKVQSILTTFAFSFLIAYLLDPLVDVFERRRIPRSLTIIALFLFIAVIIALVLAFILPYLVQEAVDLARRTPAYLTALSTMAEDLAEQFGIDISTTALTGYATERIGAISAYATKMVSGAAVSVVSFTQTMLNLFLIPIITFYFLRDFDLIRDKLFALLSRRFHLELDGHFAEFNTIISRFFRGQMTVALILAVLYSGVLLIAGVKPALLVGLVSGVLSVVPYLGFLVGFVTSVVLAAVQYNDLAHPAYVVAGFAVVQALEGNVITPKIVGESLGLHPVAVIFALMAGGYLMGIGGMIFALPVAAFVTVTLKSALAEKEPEAGTSGSE